MIYRFGPYELNARTGELRKSGMRIRLSGQPIEVLTLLVERAGDLIAREELKQALWPKETFTDFDHGVNTAVQRIRRALDDSATNPRFIETLPRKGYRFVAEVQQALDADAPVPPPAAQPQILRTWLMASAGTFAFAAAAALWFHGGDSHVSAPRAPVRVARQLTSDTGLTAWPDITRDGELVAYATDRDGGPDTDIWLHHLERDETIQLTDEPGDEIQPRFSPDGSRIVYHSLRDGGVYVVSTLGGKPQRIAREGRYARFSPDGKRIAYTIAKHGVGYASDLVLANADGSAPRVINHGTRFLGVGIVWLPDGRILTGGNRTTSLKNGDWYVLSPNGSALEPARVIRTAHGLTVSRPPPFGPAAWIEPEQAVLFSAKLGDSIDLWMRPFSLEQGKIAGPAVKVTSGGAIEYESGASATGRIVYASEDQNIDLWRLPLATDRVTAAGGPVRLTSARGAEYSPTLSGDGARFAHLVSASSSNAFRARLFFGGLTPFETTRLGEQEGIGRRLSLGNDGSKVVYSIGRSVFSRSTQAGAPRRVCADCGPFLTWSEDKQLILHSGEEGKQIVAFDPAKGEHSVLATHGSYIVQEAKISPNGSWILFHVLTSGAQFRQIFVIPFDPGRTCSDEDWIAVTDRKDNSFRAEWSPDGATVYYFSNQRGPFGIWAQRMDLESARPIGEASLVYQGSPGLPAFTSDLVSGFGLPKMAVGRDFIVFDASERRGNIWLLEPVGGGR